MKFDQTLVQGTLVRRYKRFLADVRLQDGEIITAHTPNTGSMKGCCEPGSPVWLSDSGNPKRKYPLSWELVQVREGVLVGINTGLSNRLVEQAIGNGNIAELQGYDNIRREVRYGQENSRIDLLLEQHDQLPDCYVEVKNVTLVENNTGMFPDAVSTRGSKHLRELIHVVEQGFRAALVFCVQRKDVAVMQPADRIDPEYGATLRWAYDQGVEVLAYGANPTPEQIELVTSIPLEFP